MYIAIDIGGTNTRVLVFKSIDIKTLVCQTHFPTEKNFEDQYNHILDFIHENIPDETIHGIGISQTGTVSNDKRLLLSSEFCPDFVGKPLVANLENRFKCSVIMENDALCAGFAELFFGKHSPSIKRIAYITISTGVGGVFIKKVQDKYEALKTELGHMMIAGEKQICNCCMSDCIEAYVGGHSLSQQHLIEAKDIDDLRIWEKAVEYLTIAAVNLIRMSNPEVLVFGGGMIDNNQYIRDKLNFEIKSQLRQREMPELLISDFGDSIAAFGALSLLSIDSPSII